MLPPPLQPRVSAGVAEVAVFLAAAPVAKCSYSVTGSRGTSTGTGTLITNAATCKTRHPTKQHTSLRLAEHSSDNTTTKTPVRSPFFVVVAVYTRVQIYVQHAPPRRTKIVSLPQPPIQRCSSVRLRLFLG